MDVFYHRCFLWVSTAIFLLFPKASNTKFYPVQGGIFSLLLQIYKPWGEGLLISKSVEEKLSSWISNKDALLSPTLWSFKLILSPLLLGQSCPHPVSEDWRRQISFSSYKYSTKNLHYCTFRDLKVITKRYHLCIFFKFFYFCFYFLFDKIEIKLRSM